MDNYRELLKDKKKIVVKIGSSSITHDITGNINYQKLERLVRILCDLKNQGKDVVLVSSGAIAVGRQTVGFTYKPKILAEKQACAAIGQCRLMMTYQKLFSEYNQIAAQVLITKDTIVNDISRNNAKNTFEELLKLGVIPVVNENDTVSTYDIPDDDSERPGTMIGDNDRLSAIVAAIVGADLLILLSDIDGLFTDDPNKNPEAQFIKTVPVISDELENMAKGSNSSVGTGGMSTKIAAAKIATDAGADMVIANSNNIGVIADIMNGKDIGTLFLAHKNPEFNLIDFLA